MKKALCFFLISFCVWSFLGTFSGCSVFNVFKRKHSIRSDSVSVVQKEVQSQQQETQYQEAQLQSIVISHDTSDFQAKIIPIDTFHYDPLKGFTGKAASVVVLGKMNSSEQRRDSILVKGERHVVRDVSQLDRSKTELSQSDTRQEVKRKKSCFAWLGPGLLIVVLIAGVVLLRKLRLI